MFWNQYAAEIQNAIDAYSVKNIRCSKIGRKWGKKWLVKNTPLITLRTG